MIAAAGKSESLLFSLQGPLLAVAKEFQARRMLSWLLGSLATSVCALVDEKIMCMHGGLSPEINSFDQVRRIVRPTDVPDSGLICDLLWADPEKDVQKAARIKKRA